MVILNTFPHSNFCSWHFTNTFFSLGINFFLSFKPLNMVWRRILIFRNKYYLLTSLPFLSSPMEILHQVSTPSGMDYSIHSDFYFSSRFNSKFYSISRFLTKPSLLFVIKSTPFAWMFGKLFFTGDYLFWDYICFEGFTFRSVKISRSQHVVCLSLYHEIYQFIFSV